MGFVFKSCDLMHHSTEASYADIARLTSMLVRAAFGCVHPKELDCACQDLVHQDGCFRRVLRLRLNGSAGPVSVSANRIKRKVLVLDYDTVCGYILNYWEDK